MLRFFTISRDKFHRIHLQDFRQGGDLVTAHVFDHSGFPFPDSGSTDPNSLSHVFERESEFYPAGFDFVCDLTHFFNPPLWDFII
jgi:hypothetical protein